MPEITYHLKDGGTEVLDVTPGTTVMRAAITNGVDGIIGECGGQLICATCHVYVDERYLDKLPPVSDEEDEMLDTTASPREHNSRLSCQIKMGSHLESVEVVVPPEQEESW